MAVMKLVMFSLALFAALFALHPKASAQEVPICNVESMNEQCAVEELPPQDEEETPEVVDEEVVEEEDAEEKGQPNPETVAGNEQPVPGVLGASTTTSQVAAANTPVLADTGSSQLSVMFGIALIAASLALHYKRD